MFARVRSSVVASRQVRELQEQAAGHAAEVRKLYDWRDVMKTVHNERLQELTNKHQSEKDALLAEISHRSATNNFCQLLCVALHFLALRTSYPQES